MVNGIVGEFRVTHSQPCSCVYARNCFAILTEMGYKVGLRLREFRLLTPSDRGREFTQHTYGPPFSPALYTILVNPLVDLSSVVSHMFCEQRELYSFLAFIPSFTSSSLPFCRLGLIRRQQGTTLCDFDSEHSTFCAAL